LADHRFVDATRHILKVVTLHHHGNAASNLDILDSAAHLCLRLCERLPIFLGDNARNVIEVIFEQHLQLEERLNSVLLAYAPLDHVRDNMVRTGYPEQRIHFVKGRVEDTIPAGAPDTISLLRLDTDWYESTRHELTHLFPRLSRGGVVIIDDYGHWRGARRAVDEYFAQHGPSLLLHRIDYTARAAVKP
jgi:hypothetical protein